MPLSLKNEEADRLARELARRTGEGLTEAIVRALRERLARLRPSRRPETLANELLEIGRHCNSLPLLDARSEDEILGFGPGGV